MVAIRERALEFYQFHCETVAKAREEVAKKRQDATCTALRNFLEKGTGDPLMAPIAWDGESASVLVDDILFVATEDQEDYLLRYRFGVTCPACGERPLRPLPSLTRGQGNALNASLNPLVAIAMALLDPACPACAAPEAPPLPAWKGAAIAAYDEERETRLAREEKAKLLDAAHLARALKEIVGISVQPTEDRVTVDGVTFVYDGALSIEAPCPKCGEPRRTYPICSPADVGAFLSGVHPLAYDRAHVDCDIDRCPETAADRLVSALRELLGSSGGE